MPLALHSLKAVMVRIPATSEQCAGVNGAAFLTQLTALQLTAIQSLCVFRVKCVGSHLALASHVLPQVSHCLLCSACLSKLHVQPDASQPMSV